MQLTSPLFLVFLAVCAAVYFVLPSKWQSPFLLLASYVFYFWALPRYGVVALAVTAVSYGCARWLDASSSPRARKAALAAGVLLPLATLFVFKYFDFFAAELAALVSLFGAAWTAPALGLVQPLGISYFTLTVIGYLVDVYRGDAACEKNPAVFALFVSFFPQIASGPIPRAGEMLPQYREAHRWDTGRAVGGLQRFLTGAFMKLVVADGVGRIVAGLYADAANLGWLTAIVAAAGFSVQLYCDFAGYTNMALGAGLLLGFRLPENFFAPFQAVSFGALWNRWHVSLTSWLRDYVYFPLGGSRRGAARRVLNILLVFLVSGLWHGAGVTFLVWGLLNGVARAAEELLFGKAGLRARPVSGGIAALCRASNFILFSLLFVFFKADSLAQARLVFAGLFRPQSAGAALASIRSIAVSGLAETADFAILYFAALLFGVALVWVFDRSISAAYLANAPDGNPLGRIRSAKARWALYWIMGLLTAMFWLVVNATGGGVFIYNNF